MAGGPVWPSVYLGSASGSLFPNIYQAATNTNGAGFDEGIGLVASNAANVTAYLRYFMPPGSVPTGTPKINLVGLANANTGAVKITIRDINVAANAAPATANLLVGTTNTITWVLPDNYNQLKVPISSAPGANDILVVAATFNSNCTLAQTSTWYMPLIWE